MSIGKKIKQLRRNKDLTQEELAEVLGVSVSAVSQWESERTTPDLSMLAPLCSYFSVTADELLGIDISRKEEEIIELCNEIDEISRVGRNKEAYLRFREALTRYPDSYLLMNRLASAIFWMQSESSFTEEEKKKMVEEQGRLYRRIVDGCTDESLRTSAISDLAGWYAKTGQQDKAYELLLTLPFMGQSRDFMRVDCTTGSEKLENAKNLIFDLLQFLFSYMIRNYKYDSGELLYSEEEIVRLHEKRIGLIEYIYEDGDYGFYNDWIQDSSITVAKYAAKNGDSDKAIECLTKAKKAAVGFIEFMKSGEIENTSIMLKGKTDRAAGVWFGTENDNSAAVLLREMKCAEFDCVRETEAFKKIESELKPYIGSWG